MTTPDIQACCPVCYSVDLLSVMTVPQVPIHCNILWTSVDEARSAPKGDITLAFCETCGHLFNQTFQPEYMQYEQEYENSLHFSPRFQQYAETLAAHLINRYAIREKDIIEIGCGKGDFLRLLCRLGQNRGVGFDRSYEPEFEASPGSEQVTFVQDFYTPAYAHYPADLICCQHVLEHIQYPADFLQDIRRCIGGRMQMYVFFEVPNSLYTLRDLGIWDLIYEHCGYFSAGSLTWLFQRCGFQVNDVRTLYNDQFLGLESAPVEEHLRVEPEVQALQSTRDYVVQFAQQYKAKVSEWQQMLATQSQAGKRVVIWGGGSKGVTFLNVLQTQDQISYVVDINPRKVGKFVAGTGQLIVPPEFLVDYQPDVVLVMNAIYETEIQQQMQQLGLTAKLFVV
ncbi:MAG: class I SAM-dependent methyltransferase [Chloroflexota bacterium]